jgi:hypothetical protein
MTRLAPTFSPKAIEAAAKVMFEHERLADLPEVYDLDLEWEKLGEAQDYWTEGVIGILEAAALAI